MNSPPYNILGVTDRTILPPLYMIMQHGKLNLDVVQEAQCVSTLKRYKHSFLAGPLKRTILSFFFIQKEYSHEKTIRHSIDESCSCKLTGKKRDRP